MTKKVIQITKLLEKKANLNENYSDENSGSTSYNEYEKTEDNDERLSSTTLITLRIHLPKRK